MLSDASPGPARRNTVIKTSTARPSRLSPIGLLRRLFPRVVGLAVCGLVVAAAASMGAAGTACACSCVGYTTEEAASRADGVFVARVTDKVSAGSHDIYEFEVLEVFKGNVGTVTTVETPSQGPSCGISYAAGVEYLLFASEGGGAGHSWKSSLCHGPSTPSAVDVRSALERKYGPPHPPRSAGPASEISWWTRTTAVVPLPLMAIAGVVLTMVLWRAWISMRGRKSSQS